MRNALFGLQAALPALLMVGVFIAIIASAALFYATTLLFRSLLERWRNAPDVEAPRALRSVQQVARSATGRNTLVSTDPAYFDLTDDSVSPARPSKEKKREESERPPLN
ncbi:MAG: hypothetical protein ACJ790_14590 [Myxococcaceae bacterium]